MISWRTFTLSQFINIPIIFREAGNRFATGDSNKPTKTKMCCAQNPEKVNMFVYNLSGGERRSLFFSPLKHEQLLQIYKYKT